MKAIAEAFVFDGWEWKVQCPICGYDYVHHGEVQVFARPGGEDRQTVILVPGREQGIESAYNPSGRRDAIRVQMDGECGHGWSLDIIQHKGNTFVEMSVMSEDVESLTAMPYGQYLQTEHWKQTRAAAIERAGGTCQLCNHTGELHVHHRTYERRGKELPTDLTVLCRTCHERFHNVVNGKATVTVR